MQLVVLDPFVLVNASKVPNGLSAKLLTLLAYGGVVGYLQEGAEAERRLVPQVFPVRYPSPWSALRDARFRAAEDRRTLEQALPPGRPSDFALAISTNLIARVVRRVGQLRDTEDLQLDSEVVAKSISKHAASMVFDGKEVVPDYTETGNVDANVSVHAALRSGAPMVVTKFPDACGRNAQRMYDSPFVNRDYPLGTAGAVHLDDLIDALSQKFDFHAIDASVLGRIAPRGPLRAPGP